MKEELNVEVEVEIGAVKTESALIKKLFARLSTEDCKGCKNPYINEKQVKALMRYNIWTIKQFSDVSGLTISGVNNLLRPRIVGGKLVNAKMDVCFPCPDSDGHGPKFIVRNERSERYIKV